MVGHSERPAIALTVLGALLPSLLSHTLEADTWLFSNGTGFPSRIGTNPGSGVRLHLQHPVV